MSQKIYSKEIDIMMPHIQKFVIGWKDIQAQDLIVQITVGLTNKTYIVEQIKGPEIRPQKILFKIYGDECNVLYLDRERELSVIKQLSEQFIGPKLYGATDKIRIEEYMDNEVLQTKQMTQQKYSRKVAFALSKFHSANILGISKEPSIFNCLKTSGLIIKTVRDKLSSDVFQISQQSKIEELKKQFSDDELDFLVQRIKNFQKICFSHNDLLANNILLTPPNDSIEFIDFEYSSYNFRGYDIGNYFLESQFDYRNPNPPYYFIDNNQAPQKIVEDFIRIYTLTNLGYIQNSDEVCRDDLKLDDIETRLNKEEKQNLDFINQELFEEYFVSRLLSYIFWGGWAIHMSHSTDIPFDYIQFAYDRYQLYKLEKKDLLKKLSIHEHKI